MDQDQNQGKKNHDLGDDINKVQNARLLYALGRRVVTMAGRAAAAAASPVLGPATIAIVTVTVVTIFILMGGKGAAVELSPTTPAPDTSTISTKFNSYFCQGAAKWQTSCNLATYGCSPTSMAMILNSFGTPITPPEVALRYFDGAGCNRPTDVASHISKFGSLGFTIGPNLVNLNKLNVVQVENFINAGYLIIAASGPFKCYPTNNCAASSISGHEFVIQGANPSQNTITIRDPNTCAYGSSEDIERPQHNTRNVTFDNFGYFFHAYPIKKT